MASNPTGFSPSSITTSLALWLDASDSNNLSLSGSNVLQWFDRSGNGNTFIRKTTGFPTLSNLGSVQSLYFPNLGNLVNSNIGISTSYSVFSVANRLSGSGYQYVAKFNVVSDGYFFFGVNSGNFATFAGNGSTTWWDVNANSPSVAVGTSPILLEAINNGSLITPYTNASNQNTKTGTTILTNGIMIGATQNDSQPWLGNIGEFILYNKALTTSEQQQVEGYLAWKWGLQSSLPSTHPYRNNPFLITTETVPRSIPNSAFLVPVNTYSTIKTLTLPSVSTNPGRVLILKDYLGYAGSNNIRLSTTGIDTIERSNVSSMTLSNSYGAWWFQNDGLSKWFLTSAYLNSLPIISPIPPYSNYLWSQFRNMTSSAPSFTAGGTGWGAAIGTPSNYNPINYQDGDSRIGQSDYVGIVCKGYFYSASNTTVQFRIIVDDGGYVWFNNVAVITNAWILQGDTTYTTASLNVTAGYTPFQFNFFEWGGGMTCELYYSVAGGAFTADGTGRFFYDASSQIYP